MYKDIIAQAPADIQIGILSYIDDYRSLISWIRVSKPWKTLLTSPTLEPIYRRLILQTWPNHYNLLARKKTATATAPAPTPQTHNPNYYQRILITLGKNAAEIKAGRLHAAGSLTAPASLRSVEFCYGDGYLAVFSTGRSSTAEKDAVYVYDLSILRENEGEVGVRKVKCGGWVRNVTISNGYMAWMTQDRDDDANTTSITIGLTDLTTFTTRSFKPQIQEHTFETYTEVINQEGTDAFTNPSKPRSSQILLLPNSPQFLRTNGHCIVFSSSFLTHYTVWNLNLSSETPVTGITHTLDPDWTGFLHDIWTTSPTWSALTTLTYYLTLDADSDIYTTITGFLPEKDNIYPYDRYLSRYACRSSDGKPYRMKSTAGIPPYRNPELNDLQVSFIASQLSSFYTGGYNFFNYSPANTKFEEEEMGATRDMLLQGDWGRVPRIVIDKKQPRHDEDYEVHYKADFEDGASGWATEREYDVQYINPLAVYKTPRDGGVRKWKSSQVRAIPGFGPDCVVWLVQYDDEDVVKDDGGVVKVRNVRIVGLKPMYRTKVGVANDDGDDEGGRGEEGEVNMDDEPPNPIDDDAEDQEPDEKPVRYVFSSSNIPPPASVCEVVLDYKLNRMVKWEGDDQYIVLRHYKPLPVVEGEEPPVPNFESMFTLFRYGDGVGEPVVYDIRDDDIDE
ncbi:hypothetical protein TWF730_006460 [Orbilia blumenaviensis]|uniref:F-box domain-containing protein n=1 Tax=Orbilia blumenaviensis TaxID=1796055 RepID=A0AAV9VFI2_9PEZI